MPVSVKRAIMGLWALVLLGVAVGFNNLISGNFVYAGCAIWALAFGFGITPGLRRRSRGAKILALLLSAFASLLGVLLLLNPIAWQARLDPGILIASVALGLATLAASITVISLLTTPSARAWFRSAVDHLNQNGS